MKPLGKIPVTIRLQGRAYKDDIHVFPGVSGALISWKAAKELGILPPHYPHPLESKQTKHHSKVNRTDTTSRWAGTVEQIIEEFPSVFDGQVTAMEGELFKISLIENAEPFCVKSPRSIPFAYREKLREELDSLLRQDIIAPVTEATEWCAPIVVTPKKGTNDIRLCVDLSKLNRYVRREQYQSPTPAEAVADIAASEAQVFTVLDAKKGYHQCLMDEQSQLLTTFITPFGRFKYRRAPYGLSSIAEHYNRRMADSFEGLSGFRRIVDNIIIYDKDETSHIQHVRQFLLRCRERNIALNKEKCKFNLGKVTFAGLQLSSEGYKVDTLITEAITKFPTPATRTDLRSFFGLANQLSTSTDKTAELLEPLRPLLSTKNEFTWTANHDQALATAKQHLSESPLLAYFDMHRTTRLCTDASRRGIGFVLQQQTPAGKWVLVQAGSRFLSTAESRYAIIELEMLAVVWAASKCKMFLTGMQHFQVITDHNPLIPILNNHRLDEIDNPRLQRLKMKLMAFNFTAKWCKGNTNRALSHNPVWKPQQVDALAEYDEDNQPEPSAAEIRSIINQSSQENARIQELQDHAKRDDTYQQLKEVILQGFPDHKNQLPERLRQYWELSIEDDIILHGCRLLIPIAMRKKILECLHSSHQGIVRTKQRARLALYWPGMDKDIENITAACTQCQDHLPSNHKEPLQAKPKPARPYQETAADLCFHAGKNYLVWVDCYSDWPIIAPLDKDTTATRITTVSTEIFSQTAVPDIVWTDGGPQFTSKRFQDFLHQWGIIHRKSTPHYPQSNGKAEATVKAMKKILQTAWTGCFLDKTVLCESLMQYRNTPSAKDGLSPAQKLYGHPIQDSLPIHPRAFAPEWQQSTAETERRTQQSEEAATRRYNSTASNLPEINVGTHVAVQNARTRLWDTYGIVTWVGPHRQYHIRTANGQTMLHNRRFIRRCVPTSIPPGQRQEEEPPQAQRRSARQGKPVCRLLEDPSWS